MFLTKKTLKEKILHLEYRIADLEERLCPCEQHDMVLIKHSFEIDIGGRVWGENIYKCKRCGKIVKEYD